MAALTNRRCTVTTERDDSGGEIPRWAATAGHWSWRARLRCTAKRRLRRGRCHDRAVHADRVSAFVREVVLRDYHAATTAKARRAAEQLVLAGFNTGVVPYGYRPQRVRVTPAGRRPRWRTRLVIEPVEASTVRMIFLWRGQDRLPIAEILRRLTAARYPAPLDPETGQPGVWTAGVVRSVLRNPKYLGRQVWGRRHHGRRAPRACWVWSQAWAHPPVVTAEEFLAANRHTRLATAPPESGDPFDLPSDRWAA
ncbi:recombinase [Prauserella flavalba]|uniref:Recombinase n=1 Tax=Prauserella flavalba TaxID=1477506 RepID=A0A318LMV8_9PSEU|nr:recombinase [Prauserella flavalba]